METDDTLAAARLLHRCRERGEVIGALPGRLRPRALDEGYAIQARGPEVAGEPACGWKIAATSRGGQRHIGVDGPLAGRLLAPRLHHSPARVPLGANRMRVAEAEFTFALGADLDRPPYGRDAVMAAVTALHPAIELPDSRFEDFVTAGAAQLAADNACAHLFVLGTACAGDWRRLDLAAHPVTVRIGEVTVVEGSGADVLGDPRDALAWIANANAERGEPLRAGDLVTTGVCGRPAPIAAGDRVVADFGALGTVEVLIE